MKEYRSHSQLDPGLLPAPSSQVFPSSTEKIKFNQYRLRIRMPDALLNINQPI